MASGDPQKFYNNLGAHCSVSTVNLATLGFEMSIACFSNQPSKGIFEWHFDWLSLVIGAMYTLPRLNKMNLVPNQFSLLIVWNVLA